MRSDAEFAGERFWPSGATEGAGRPGHISGAVHLHADLLRTTEGAFKNAEELRQLFLLTCRKVGATVHDGGVYVNMEGPAFSTRAESRTHHALNYDVIGMTNLGEAKCAREAEIAYATMAMVTDYDCWKEDEAPVTVEIVLENLQRNAAQAKAIVAQTIPLIPTKPNWPCHEALRHAIMTDKKFWPAKTKTMLKPLLEKYL